MSAKQTRLVSATACAAFLVQSGFPVRGMQHDGRGIAFLFDDDPRLSIALLNYTNGKAKVEPRAFLQALNDLRDLARSTGRGTA